MGARKTETAAEDLSLVIARMRQIAAEAGDRLLLSDGRPHPDHELLDLCADALHWRRQTDAVEKAFRDEQDRFHAACRAEGRCFTAAEAAANEDGMRVWQDREQTMKNIMFKVRKLRAQTAAGIYAKALIVRSSATGAPILAKSLAEDLIACPGLRENLWPAQEGETTLMPASRRGILGGVAALLAGAAVHAMAATAPNTDAELIAACQQFEALEWRYLGLFYGPGRIEDDDERDESIHPIHGEQDDLLEAISDMHATTLEGFRALARAAVIWAPDKIKRPEDMSDELTATLLTRLAGQDWFDNLIDFKNRGEAANRAALAPLPPPGPGEPGYNPELAEWRAAVWANMSREGA